MSLSEKDFISGNWKQRNDEEKKINALNGIDITFIQQSTIDNAGEGLFAAKKFNPGDLIAFYAGKILDSETDYGIAYSKVEKDYSSNMIEIDANNIENGDARGFAHMANDSRNGKQNAYYGYYGFIRAITSIEKDREIFISYGRRFWNDRFTMLDMMFIPSPATQNDYSYIDKEYAEAERLANRMYFLPT